MATSSREIAAEIEAKIRKDAEVKLKSKGEAEKIRDEVRAETPILKKPSSKRNAGDAAASVHVEERKDRDGLPHWWVGTRLWYFHFLELGTKADPEDSKSPFGPDTPTKEYAPFAKVAHRHGGTTGGIEVDG